MFRQGGPAGNASSIFFSSTLICLTCSSPLIHSFKHCSKNLNVNGAVTRVFWNFNFPSLIWITAFSKLLDLFANQSSNRVGIDKTSLIDDSVSIGANVYVGSFSVCEKDSDIGENSKIYSQVFIGENVSLGSNTIIYPGVKIYSNSVIGNNCIIHSGTVIGSDGFGFNLDKDGNQLKVIHNGNVIIKDNVEIGANCTVDKATLGSTLIKKGVKIDNLVHIAHNCEIGENTIIAAMAGFAGSTKVGKGCMIGGGARIAPNISIADKTVISPTTAIGRSIKKEGQRFTGVLPPLNHKDWLKFAVKFMIRKGMKWHKTPQWTLMKY